MNPSTQTTRRTAALKWTDYLLNDLDPSDEGWEMSMVLKELAKQYEAYDDQTPHPFGDGYNIRWKRYFVMVFQALLKTLVLPQGTVALVQAIEMLERPAAPKQVGPVIIRGVPEIEPAADTANSNAANFNAGNVNSADLVRVENAANGNNTVHAVSVIEGETPTFKFKSSGPARVQVRLNRGGVAASSGVAGGSGGGLPGAVGGAVAVVAARGTPGVPGSAAPFYTFAAPDNIADRAPDVVVAQAPGTGVPDSVAALGPHVTNTLGTATTRAPAPDPPAAPEALATSGTIAGPGTVVPAAPDPAPAVVAFAARAPLVASEGVGNVNPMVTGWEGMGFGDMGFEEWSSISSMSSNTETDSDIA
ncbi:hypothetical protein B0T13DRAFT_314312 [Neurospora crassa]|nr:hypothetical protein B0T13DRAFT_314312 [Neurospora crassa]